MPRKRVGRHRGGLWMVGLSALGLEPKWRRNVDAVMTIIRIVAIVGIIMVVRVADDVNVTAAMGD